MTPDAIRSQYVEALARADYGRWQRAYDKISEHQEWGDKAPSWEVASDDHKRKVEAVHKAELLADDLAAAGLLPTIADYRWVYEPDGTPLGYRKRQLSTDWRDAALRCSGCGMTERECGAKLIGARGQITARWPNTDEMERQKAAFKCCPDCGHPWTVVSE